MVSPKGEDHLERPTQVMSLNPSCTVIEKILASSQDITISPTKSLQARMQVKPRLMNIFEKQMWQPGDADQLKFLGFGTASTESEICMYFPEVQNSPHATCHL